MGIIVNIREGEDVTVTYAYLRGFDKTFQCNNKYIFEMFFFYALEDDGRTDIEFIRLY